MLDVGDGHEIYWEVCGNPRRQARGVPARRTGRRLQPRASPVLRPARYRIVLFDQRGCGRSTPHAATRRRPRANTTWHLVADMERLRDAPRHRSLAGVRRVLGQHAGAGVRADASRARDRTGAARHLHAAPSGARLVLRAAARRRLFPDLWEDFVAPVPPADRADLIEAYGRLPRIPTPRCTGRPRSRGRGGSRRPSRCCPRPTRSREFTEPEYATAFARIENHYFVTAAGGGGPAHPRRRVRPIPP